MTRRPLIVVVGLLLLVASVVAGLFATLDAPTAAFFTFALALVSFLGAAPIIFSVHTRRKAREFNERLERESELVLPHQQRAEDHKPDADQA